MEPIRIVIAGDFCSTHPEDLSIGDSLNKLIHDADLRCVNFEGPLQTGEIESANGSFLQQSYSSPRWLKDKGFNVIALANNHACDFGETGLKASKDAFGDAVTLGCGEGWTEAYRVRYVEVKGKKIGFFNATSADFSSLKDRWTDENKYGCAWVNHPSVPLILQRAKQQCDYLIILPHAGVEYMDVPLPEWRTIYRTFVDCGADAVIASHPHVPQGWEIYNGKPIYYSLGNFVFERNPPSTAPNWYNGLVVQLILDEDSVAATHYSVVYSNNQVELDRTVERKEYLKALGGYLSDDEVYKRQVDDAVPVFAKKYEQWMLSGIGAFRIQPFRWISLLRLLRFIVKNRNKDEIFLHQLREESTRWTIQRCYYLRSKAKR